MSNGYNIKELFNECENMSLTLSKCDNIIKPLMVSRNTNNPKQSKRIKQIGHYIVIGVKC